MRAPPPDAPIGWQLGILGTTYAVILGFMLYTVWINFGAADLNADAEANAVVNVYRLADGLPSYQRTQIQQTACAYADAVINKDWPAMARNDPGQLESHTPTRSSWRILMSAVGRVNTPTELTAEDHALRAKRPHGTSPHPPLAERLPATRDPLVRPHRRHRHDHVELHVRSGKTPGCTPSRSSFFSLLIALVLVAIADIDRPFQGVVHVSDWLHSAARSKP